MIGVGGKDWKHYVGRKPQVVKRHVRKGIPNYLQGLVWQLVSSNWDLLLMNQGVYEVFGFCRFFSLLGNCTNSSTETVAALVQTMFAWKDKRYRLDFECIKFFLCCKKGQKIKAEQGVLHLEFNMMLIKPICLTVNGVV
jgi:hypothetical protein